MHMRMLNLDNIAAAPAGTGEPEVAPAYAPTWLAPTPADRARVTEIIVRLEPAMRWVGLTWLLAVAAAFVDGHANPLWTIGPLVVCWATVASMTVLLPRSRRPELLDAAQGLVSMVAAALSAGMTGGSHSPMLLLLALGTVVGAARSILRVSAAICGISLAVLAGSDALASATFGWHETLRLAAVATTMAALTAIGRAMVRVEREARAASEVDALTGLLSRGALPRGFDDLHRQAVDGESICLVLFDLDHFKSVNDDHGHDVGDAVLREVGRRVIGALRRFELVYRIGGEEFAVVIRGLSEAGGVEVAERIKDALTARPIAGLSVTASFGVSAAPAEAAEFLALYRHADRALYDAKNRGRNRISSAARPRVVAA